MSRNRGRRTRSSAVIVCALGVSAALSGASGQGCAISGRVLDDAGRPIRFAVVNAARERVPGIDGSLFMAGGASSDERGQYCIRDLPPGTYLVRSMGGGRPAAASARCRECCLPRMGSAVTFYPRSSAPAGAAPLTIAGGRRFSGIDIKILPVPLYCLRGEVRDARGTLLPDVGLSVEQGPWSTGVVNDGGRFLVMALPPGTYTLTVLGRQRLGPVLWRGDVEVRGGSANRIAIVVRPGV